MLRRFRQRKRIVSITRREFEQRTRALEGGHWTQEMMAARWDYHRQAAELVQELNPAAPSRVLEIGTMGVQVVRGSDTLDYGERWDFPGKEPTFLHDARTTPWPMNDKSYDIVLALRVFQHLVPVQRECLVECLRVGRHVILVVPRAYVNPILPDAKGVTFHEFCEFIDGAYPKRFVETAFGDLYHWDAESLL